jgi:predicted transcriptional regulator
MPYTRTFEGYAPPRRYDSVPFTSALIREAAFEAGPYTTIQTIALSPLDADPSAPATRNFTTALAAVEDGWYVIRWSDGSSTFDSDPIRYQTSGTAYANVTQLREALDLTDVELPDEAATELILSAEDWIDAQLGARETDPATGRKVIEEEVQPWQWTKLNRATVKVASRLHANPDVLQSQQWDTIKGPDFETSGRSGSLFGTEVSDLLIDAYLIVRSGRAR